MNVRWAAAMAAAATAGMWSASTARAMAAGPVSVRVASPACAQEPAFTSFVSSLRAELAGHDPSCCTVEAPDAPPPRDGAVTLSVEPCDASATEAVISVGEGAPVRTATRHVSLADVKPGARPRALALAAAELVRSAGMTPAPPTPSPPPPPGARLVGGADADLRLFPSLGTWLLGGRGTISSVGRRWTAVLDMAGAAGRQRFDAGDVTVRLASLGLSVGPRLASRRAILDLGLGAEIGWAWIDGQAVEPVVRAGGGSGPVIAAGARIAIEAPSSWALRLRVVAQAGDVLRGLRGTVEGTPGAGISGPFLLIGVGVSGP